MAEINKMSDYYQQVDAKVAKFATFGLFGGDELDDNSMNLLEEKAANFGHPKFGEDRYIQTGILRDFPLQTSNRLRYEQMFKLIAALMVALLFVFLVNVVGAFKTKMMNSRVRLSGFLAVVIVVWVLFRLMAALFAYKATTKLGARFDDNVQNCQRYLEMEQTTAEDAKLEDVAQYFKGRRVMWSQARETQSSNPVREENETEMVSKQLRAQLYGLLRGSIASYFSDKNKIKNHQAFFRNLYKRRLEHETTKKNIVASWKNLDEFFRKPFETQITLSEQFNMNLDDFIDVGKKEIKFGVLGVTQPPTSNGIQEDDWESYLSQKYEIPLEVFNSIVESLPTLNSPQPQILDSATDVDRLRNRIVTKHNFYFCNELGKLIDKIAETITNIKKWQNNPEEFATLCNSACKIIKAFFPELSSLNHGFISENKENIKNAGNNDLQRVTINKIKDTITVHFANNISEVERDRIEMDHIKSLAVGCQENDVTITKYSCNNLKEDGATADAGLETTLIEVQIGSEVCVYMKL
jgi:hypothetical protein